MFVCVRLEPFEMFVIYFTTFESFWCIIDTAPEKFEPLLYFMLTSFKIYKFKLMSELYYLIEHNWLFMLLSDSSLCIYYNRLDSFPSH